MSNGYKRMFLIRHAQSTQNTLENNKEQLPDNLVPLTEKGKAQAKATGEFLKLYVLEHRIDLSKATLYVSPYQRTRQTAEIINESLQIKDVREDVTLIEQMYGLFSDKSISTIRKEYPEEFAYYDKYHQSGSRFYAKFPQGESPFDVALRTRMFLNSLSNNQNPLFIVSHGVTLKTILLNYFNYTPEWFAEEPNMENSSVRLIETLLNSKKEKYIYGGPMKKITKPKSRK